MSLFCNLVLISRYFTMWYIENITSYPLRTGGAYAYANLPKMFVNNFLSYYLRSQSGTLESALKELKWWGPQQSTWNPVKVES